MRLSNHWWCVATWVVSVALAVVFVVLWMNGGWK